MAELDLTRYSLWVSTDEDVCVERDDAGDWVKYEDVAPIIEEVKRLREENAERDKVKALHGKVEYLRAQNAELKDELAALRTRVLEWVTVTEDPKTLPMIDRRCLVQLIDDNDDDARRDEPMCVCKMWGPPSFDNEEDWPHFQQEYEPYHALPVIPGDRWAYIPEAPHA